MADDGSCESWLDRWRAGCRAKDAACLLALLEEDRESGKANVGTLKPDDIANGARVACEKGELDLLRQVIGVVEAGVCERRGIFDRAFVKACGGGHVEMVRELLSVSGVAAVNVHEGFSGDPEFGFRYACVNGKLEVVRELLALTGEREVDVHAAYRGEPEGAFRLACDSGHVEVVQELLALSGHREVDVHAEAEGEPEYGFRYACESGQVDMVRELLGLTGHRAIPLHTRLAAGEVAVLPAKDAVWGGTSTRRGRACVVLLRAGKGR